MPDSIAELIARNATKRADAIAQCRLCNISGYRLPGCTVACDHVDRRKIAKRGMATVRLAMGWGKR